MPKGNRIVRRRDSTCANRSGIVSGNISIFPDSGAAFTFCLVPTTDSDRVLTAGNIIMSKRRTTFTGRLVIGTAGNGIRPGDRIVMAKSR